MPPVQRGSLGGRGLKSAAKFRPVTVTLDPSTLALLDSIAARKGVTRSALVTEMIELYSEFDAEVVPALDRLLNLGGKPK